MGIVHGTRLILHLQESVQHKLTFLHLYLFFPQFPLQLHSVGPKRPSRT